MLRLLATLLKDFQLKAVDHNIRDYDGVTFDGMTLMNR
jgi:hypothetical protein